MAKAMARGDALVADAVPGRKTFPRRCFAVAFVLGVAACAPLDTNVPVGFDLAGHWVVDELASDPPPDIKAIRRREDRQAVRDRPSKAGGSAAFVVQDFPVLAAASLHIEQDRDSMGIRYGETIYRDISWGERKRDFWTVKTGWEEGSLAVRSTRGGVRGRETFTLEDGGKRLRVAVQVKTAGENIDSVRVFHRR